MAIVDGDFICGGDWIPDAGFDPISRSWYKGAIEKDDIYIKTFY
ncbi:MAG TPA: hypothetical protein VK071_08815 [Tissierellales bacterium]|nr:hypothetical protein [Tissierellales bacterium]